MRCFVCLLSIALACLCVSLAYAAHLAGVDASSGLLTVVKMYREGLRTPFFTGFLTIGTFLLTLQAQILLRIKEIYDDKEYQVGWENYQEQRKAQGKKLTGYYEPLKNLGVALLANVVLALTSSVVQATFGLVNAAWAVGIWLGFAGTTLGLLLVLWWQIAVNLVRWFSYIERKRKA